MANNYYSALAYRNYIYYIKTQACFHHLKGKRYSTYISYLKTVVV